ncbi:MAG: GNAT family N-acetyltransferase [Lutibacter sp.]|nr:GNAT family N-acetyltransferase [Lutibacter sp.]
MRNYGCLTNSIFKESSYSIVPLRYEDRLDIMKWRNEQIYHLRQSKPLTVEEQENYFLTVVDKLFDEVQPNQILFSYLENGKCIGYGGLVHINWIDKNAEISFIMDTALEKFSFSTNWKVYLGLIEKIGFEELGLYKLYTYAIDLRPQLYQILELSGYDKEAVLKNHVSWLGKMVDIVIHSKFMDNK